MPVTILDRGKYEIFETDHGHEILLLDGKGKEEKRAGYEEWILPNGLPTASDPQKRLVLTSDTIGKDELEEYLKQLSS
jgi:hypothetical protein